MSNVYIAPGEVGPFPGNKKPARPGMYVRISPHKRNRVWSWWDGRQWGMFGTNQLRAIERRHKRSKNQSLQWIGRDKPAKGRKS